MLAKGNVDKDSMLTIKYASIKYGLSGMIIIEIINIIAVPFKYHTASTPLAYSSLFLCAAVIQFVLLRKHKRQMKLGLVQQKLKVESLYPEGKRNLV